MSKCKNKQPKQPNSKDVDMLAERFPVHLTPKQTYLARTLQQEAAKVWNAVCTVHRMVYTKHHCWLDEGAMKNFVKGKYGIHSQSIQAVVETYFEACERTRQLHEKGHTDWRYPHHIKPFFTVTWKSPGITHKRLTITLSNGRGREPLVIDLPSRCPWTGPRLWQHSAVAQEGA